MKLLVATALALLLTTGAVCGQVGDPDAPSPVPEEPHVTGTIDHLPHAVSRGVLDGGRHLAVERNLHGENHPLYGSYHQLLRAHVSKGVVDYGAIAKAPEPLAEFLTTLADVDPGSYSSPYELKALWINAYNAFTLRLILDHWPDIESIKDIPRGDRWKAVRWDVGGKTYSLDQIEHEILRPMGDARIHFALVCAAKSCPNLLSEAYLPAYLDEQLERAGAEYLADRKKGLSYATEEGILWGESHVLRLSAIFDWFEEDFGRSERELIMFVQGFAPPDAADFIIKHRADLEIEHLDYDWSLNGR